MARSTHWSDIHQMLLATLPDRSVVRFSHTVTGFEQRGRRVSVSVMRTREDDQEELTLSGDLLVAADGSMSSTRAKLTGSDARRCAPPARAGACCRQGADVCWPGVSQRRAAAGRMQPPGWRMVQCRYSGYCAWRGVMREDENPQVRTGRLTLLATSAPNQRPIAATC